MRRYHDLGGQPAGPIDTSDHNTEPWTKTLTAIVGALRAQGLSRVDELRRHIEDLAPQDYDRSYFERWAEAICDLLEEKGLTSRAEIEARMAVIKSALEART
jgi:Nitrile hydratase beta subunit